MTPPGPARARVEALFQEVLDAPASEREALLNARTAGDPAVREAVERLLRASALAGTFLETSPVPPREAGEAVPTRVGLYEVTRLLGRGGMGVVYEARQQNPSRTVALKVIAPAHTSDAMVRRFQREADVLGHLQHPGIACIYEAGSAMVEGRGWSVVQPYLAMEFVRGESLTAYAATHGLPLRDRLELVAKVADAVQHAHEQGVIHRDLKPSNILVDATGQPKVLDFGIAKLVDPGVRSLTAQTAEGQLIGTLDYMSPEQVEGQADALDARTDLYALGVVLYELLTGRLPHDLRGRPVPEAARIIREDEPSRLALAPGPRTGGTGRVDRDIETIVAKALEKDRRRRYATAAELAADLRRYLTDRPIVARPASRMYLLSKFAKRNRALVGGVVATFGVLVAGLVGVSIVAQHATQERRAAEQERARAERQAYRTSLAAAWAAVQRDDGPAAVGYLDEAPPALRRWEWTLLKRMADPGDAWGQLPDGGNWLVEVRTGELLAASSDEGVLRVVDYRTGATRAALQRPGRHDTVFIALPGGTDIIVGGAGEGLERVELATGRTVWRLDSPRSDWTPGISPDGTLLAVTTERGRRVAVVETRTGTLRGSFEAVCDLPPPCFSRDNAMLAAGDRVVEVGSWRVLWMTGGQFQDFSPDGARAAVVRARGGPDGMFSGTIVDARTGAALGSFPMTLPFTWTWPGIVFREDSRVVLAIERNAALVARDATTLGVLSSAVLRPRDGTTIAGGAAIGRAGAGLVVAMGSRQGVRFFDADSPGATTSVPVWNTRTNDAHVAPDASLVARCDWGTVSLSDGATGRTRWRRHLGIFNLQAVRLSPDASRLACDGGSGFVNIMRAADGSVLQRLAPLRDAGAVVALRWADASRLVVACESGAIVRWNADEASPQPTVLASLSARPTALAASGDRVVAAAGRTLVRIDAATGGARWTHELPDASAPGGVVSLEFAPVDRSIACGVQGGVELMSDSGDTIASLRGASTPVRCVGWDHSGERLWAAAEDSRVLLWDYPPAPGQRSAQEVASFLPAASRTIDLAVSGDGARVTLAAAAETVSWDLRRPGPELAQERTRWQRASGVVRAAQGERDSLAGVLEAIASDPRLGADERADALSLARDVNVFAPKLNSVAWGLVLRRDDAPGVYADALAKARAASEALPDDWGVTNTLGLALYRAREDEKAVAALRRADELAVRAGQGEQPSNWAVMAMALRRLGRRPESDEAWARAGRLLEAMPAPRREASRPIMDEAEATLRAP